jgi:hypothetical protein
VSVPWSAGPSSSCAVVSTSRARTPCKSCRRQSWLEVVSAPCRHNGNTSCLSAGLLEPTPGLEPGDPFITRERQVRDARPLAGTGRQSLAGNRAVLQLEQWTRMPARARADVPVLYPPRATGSCCAGTQSSAWIARRRSPVRARLAPSPEHRSSHLAARQASNPKRSQFANFAISAAVSPRAAGNKCRDSASEKRG